MNSNSATSDSAKSDSATSDAVSIHQYLIKAVELGAADLHFVVGHPPTVRLHGSLTSIDGQSLTGAVAEESLKSICPDHLWKKFHEHKNIDFAYQLNSPASSHRFRANYFFNGKNIGACFRLIPSKVPALEWSGIPRRLVERLAHFRNGLVLLSGVTGSGKTTTLAMIIRMLVEEGGYRIVTVEEPIEYIFQADMTNTIVTQREVGQDVDSFADGLKYSLRQDPDVILIGEIRDQQTAQMALSAAETGHLVFSTLHTRDAKGAISRFVDLFPQAVQNDVRSQLALSLRAVVSQHLIPSIFPGQKREPALEVMFNNFAIASGIRSGRLETIDSNIQMGRSDGMISLDESIKTLLQNERISRADALRFVSSPSSL